jgi:hypothetical protein
MPFTLAHPAFILPFRKTKMKLSITGLVAGSIAPDFEFFFQLREVENIGHHWYGVLLFDLPAAVILAFVFHGLLRNLCIANLPTAYRNRFLHLREFNWNGYSGVNKGTLFLSVMIGILSHLFIDGFTHADGLFVTAIPVLQKKFLILSSEVPMYFLLQIIFSIGGLMVLFTRMRQKPKLYCNTGLVENTKFFWPLFLGLLLIVVAIRLISWSQYNSFWSVVMALMGGIVYSLLLTALILRFNQSYKKNKHELI